MAAVTDTNTLLRRAVAICTLCGAFSAAAYYFINVYAFALSLPLFAIALSRVIIDLMAELRHGVRQLGPGDLQGRHFEFEGRRLQVFEDADHAYWLAAAQLRAIVGGGASDALLERTFAGAWQWIGKPPQGFLRDDALTAHLGTVGSPSGIRFRNWVERNIAFPARRRRAQFGVRLEAFVPEKPMQQAQTATKTIASEGDTVPLT